MIARGFQPVIWVAAVGTAALGCYMLSLQVASERAELASLERRIVATQQQIRSLQTELGTRGRLQQLEQWNAEVLALSAPVAGQFLESGVALARFDTRVPTLDDRAPVRMASAEAIPAPSAPAAQAARPAPRQAVADVRTAQAPAPLEQPLVRRASLASDEAQRPTVRPAAAQPRSASLLDDGTLRDLRTAARAEGEGGNRN